MVPKPPQKVVIAKRGFPWQNDIMCPLYVVPNLSTPQAVPPFTRPFSRSNAIATWDTCVPRVSAKLAPGNCANVERF